jgi:hypothetical protein
MRNLTLVAAALLGLSAPAFGSLTFVLSPSVEVSPPGTDPATCEATGVAPCVIFSGTLADTDADNLYYIALEDISVSFTNPSDSAYFTLDNTFFDDVPGGLEGDTLNNPFPNSYSGPIFGIDIDPSTPVGVYSEMAVISAAGGDGDPGYDGFTVEEGFTVIISSPEPASALTLGAGLLALVALRRGLRSRPC